MGMKAIYIGSTFRETVLTPSKRYYCELLGCEVCTKDTISIEDHKFGIVHDSNPPENAYVSGINIYDSPELVGDFIIFGIKKKRLVGLTDEEITFLKNHVGEIGGSYILTGIE